MTDQEPLFIKVTDHFTAEIIEREVKNADEAKDLLMQLSASETAIKKAKDRLKKYLSDFLGDDETYEFSDGRVLRRVQRSSLVYKVESLRQYLDEDQIDVCLKVDNKTTEALIQELMERGDVPPDTLKKIKEEADSKVNAAFVEVK